MHLIFDFDGTLVDSFQCVVEKLILLADEFNFHKITLQEVERMRDLSTKEIIRFLQIPLYKIPLIIYRIRKYMHNEITALPPVSNIPYVLEKLNAAGFCLGILTSNSEENVSLWLESFNLRHLFKFVRVESHHFSKKHLLKKIIAAYQLDKSKAFFIADETRDIEAAKKNEIHSVGVTWGFNSEKALLSCEPHYLVRKPEDLLSLYGLST